MLRMQFVGDFAEEIMTKDGRYTIEHHHGDILSLEDIVHVRAFTWNLGSQPTGRPSLFV